jgi:hypothetical protein
MPSNTQYTQTRHLPSALRVESHLDVGDIWNPPTTEDGSSASEESQVELTGRLPLFHGIVSQDTMVRVFICSYTYINMYFEVYI